jgi:hypothetical protein
MPPRLRIGLTGGIASGKSTVEQRFVELGVPVIDADDSSRAVVAPGQPGLAAVVKRFGAGILTPRASSIAARCARSYSADRRAQGARGHPPSVDPRRHGAAGRRRGLMWSGDTLAGGRRRRAPLWTAFWWSMRTSRCSCSADGRDGGEPRKPRDSGRAGLARRALRRGGRCARECRHRSRIATGGRSLHERYLELCRLNFKVYPGPSRVGSE